MSEEMIICQSCSAPIMEENQFGTNADGSKNQDYCIYCYENGKFNQDMTLEEFSEFSLQFAEQAGMTKEQMQEHCRTVLPTLKRWKN